jgi:catechol 2,3-dioxygenase-like lactoylglutathione lyase family enzyme
MQVIERRASADPQLAQFWGLDPEGVAEQVLLRTPGVSEGGVHLVRFHAPGAAVREDATPTDLVPKSVDIVVSDIDARYRELTAAGYRFRSAVGTMKSERVTFREAHMLASDGLNLVMLEVLGAHEPVSERGFGVAPQIVVITPDNERESAFLKSALGLAPISHSRFAGPEVERTIGLPPGAALDVRILGDPQRHYGRLELVQYEGVKSRNLYPRARPPARGMLSVTYLVRDLAEVLVRADPGSVVDAGVLTTIYGRGRMARLTTPAGLRIELVETMHDAAPFR